MRRRIVVPLLAAVSLSLAGCSGDDEPAATPAESPSASATTGASPSTPGGAPRQLAVTQFPVPAGARPHDVAPAADGGVWFTAQGAGYLGHLDPADGTVTQVPLGDGSAPHGVITGPDRAAWVTDQGRNAIIRVDGATREVQEFPLPTDRDDAAPHTATFDPAGILWFTGQGGAYGRLDPRTGDMQVRDAPGGGGPYGITATPDGQVYYASLAGSHVAHVDPGTGRADVLEPPTGGQGARRVWSDSAGRIWVSEWNAGQLARYDPATRRWTEWPLPGDGPQAYAVFVDERDIVWVSDFGSNQMFRFDPVTERFTAVELPGPAANVRQILGRPGEVWAAASALDRILLIDTGTGPAP